MAFDDRGKPVTGCTARHLDSKGQATCHVTYTGAGSHTITAAYSGDTAYAGATTCSTPRHRPWPKRSDPNRNQAPATVQVPRHDAGPAKRHSPQLL